MANPPTPPNDMMSELLTQALTGVFESVKGKVTTNVKDHGEEYLQGAVEKIKEATSSVVEWAKENPMKTALAVAALAAVSTFLIRTMTSSKEAASEDDASDSKTGKSADKAHIKSGEKNIKHVRKAATSRQRS